MTGLYITSFFLLRKERLFINNNRTNQNPSTAEAVMLERKVPTYGARVPLLRASCISTGNRRVRSNGEMITGRDKRKHSFKCHLSVTNLTCNQVRTKSLQGGGGPHATYNLYLILKLMLQNSCRKYSCNMTLFATTFTYTHTYIHTDTTTSSVTQSHCLTFLCVFRVY